MHKRVRCTLGASTCLPSRRSFLYRAGLLIGANFLGHWVGAACAQASSKREEAWAARMLTVEEPVGWAHDDYFCWGGDALIGPGEEGPETVHFYGTRWPKWSGFMGWLWRSEICRATSASLTGPFTTRQVLIGERQAAKADGSYYWDHHSVFNSTTLVHEGKVYLFYTGTSHDPARRYGPRDVPQLTLSAAEISNGHERMSQRIGVMVGESPTGPWHRPDASLFAPDEPWAPFFHCNPSATLGPDGRCYLYYKTLDSRHRTLKFAVAVAEHPAGPYVEHADNPIIDPGPGAHIEDMCVWVQDGRFHMLFKDMSGRICGVPNGTALLDSADGIRWDLSHATLAFTPKWRVPGGWEKAHRMERANLLLRGGRPIVLYCAVLNGDERLDPTHPLHHQLTPDQVRSLPPLASRNIAIRLRIDR